MFQIITETDEKSTPGSIISRSSPRNFSAIKNAIPITWALRTFNKTTKFVPIEFSDAVNGSKLSEYYKKLAKDLMNKSDFAQELLNLQHNLSLVPMQPVFGITVQNPKSISSEFVAVETSEKNMEVVTLFERENYEFKNSKLI